MKLIYSLLIEKIFNLALKGLGLLFAEFQKRNFFKKVEKEQKEKVQKVKDAKNVNDARSSIRNLD